MEDAQVREQSAHPQRSERARDRFTRERADDD